MHIRQARATDALSLADLVWQSSAEYLAWFFPTYETRTVRDFLVYSFAQPYGQYGYANHWVAEHEQRAMAVVSAWHTELPEAFHSATLSCIVDFYGMQQAERILNNNQRLQGALTSVQPNEWCIGHLAVELSHRRKGVAAALLDYMLELAIAQGKTCLSLDVADTNQDAQAFYRTQGFEAIRPAPAQAECAKQIGLAPFLRFQRLL